MSVEAAYLIEGHIGEDPVLYVARCRGARGVPTWAVLKSLGRSGLIEMIDRSSGTWHDACSRHQRGGFRCSTTWSPIMRSWTSATQRNPDPLTEIADTGTMFAGPTVWQGHTAMRISVSNYGTTEAEIDESIDAVLTATPRRQPFPDRAQIPPLPDVLDQD